MMQSRAGRHMFSASDDTTMTEHIRATHAPVNGHIDVRPLLNVVQDIFHRAASLIPAIVQGNQMQMGTMKDSAHRSHLADVLDISYHTINKISCEICCKCLDGDVHATSMGILGMLSSYSWDGKVVIALAAFAANLGEFWLVAQLYATNRLAKSVAKLKHIHETLEQMDDLGPKFETINNLAKAMLDVTNYIIQFHELPTQYIDPEAPEMLTASTLIPGAVYWTIRSIVSCASHIIGITGLGQGYMASTIETWELSSLAHKLDYINSRLRKQLSPCHQHLDENKQREAFETLRFLFSTSHQDNFKVLKAMFAATMICYHCLMVSIEVLRKKIVLLYISDLHNVPDQELVIFEQMYQVSHQESNGFESQHELVWIPVVDKAIPWTEVKPKFDKLQAMMSCYSLYDPALLEPATIRYIREIWLFKTKPILVALDAHGKVVNLNAIPMMWIWGSLAYPFSSAREEALWNEETWGVVLLVDSIEPSILDWISEGKYICLFGGGDIEWIRKFTITAESLAKALQLPLEMIYVGKSNPGKKVQEINKAIQEETLSNVLSDIAIIWFFWVRLESMWQSKSQQSKTVGKDQIMHEVMRILTYDCGDPGWALITQGTGKMAQGKGDTFLKCLHEHEQWKDTVKDKGLLPAMDDYIRGLQTPHHCNRLILPGTSGGIPDKVTCSECGRTMEMFYMYRCCNE